MSVHEGHALPGTVPHPPAVSGDQAALVVRRNRSDARRVHPERFEDALVHEFGEGLPGSRLGHHSGQREAQVRVLPLGLGRIRGLLVRDRVAHRLGLGELELGPGGMDGLPGQAGGVGKEVPHGHRPGFRMTVLNVEPGKVLDDGIVETKRPGVPLAQHADRGEELRMGGDPEDRVLVHRRLGIQGRVSVRLQEDDVLVVDDPDHESDPRVLDLRADPLVEHGDAGLDLRVRMLRGADGRGKEERGEDSARQDELSEHFREAGYRRKTTAPSTRTTAVLA